MTNDARPRPLVQMLPPGKYAICACGLTGTPPLCDGSHSKGTGPVMHTVEITHANIAWCTCRKSSKLPLCDGTHTRAWPEFRNARPESPTTGGDGTAEGESA